MDTVPDIDASWTELGLARTEAENAQLAERLLRPSLNINGLESGAVGERARNVIPTRRRTAAIDIRLVSGNDPEAMLDLVEAHIRAQGYFIVREEPDQATREEHPLVARISRSRGYPAVRTRMDDPFVQQVIQAAKLATEDRLILLPGMGGSLPLYLFQEVLEAPLVIVPIANHDDNQHAPDENLRLANLWYGIDLMGSILTMH